MQPSLRWLLLGVTLLSGCVIHRSLTREQILERVRGEFPIERRKSLFYVRLQNPDVIFPGGERLGVRLEVEAGAPLVKHTGHAAAEGTLDFHDGGIYLKDAEMRELDLGVDLPADWGPPVMAAIQTAILAVLVERPIYEIHDGRVKKMWVEGDKLTLEIRP
jgi:hypothetical protein